MNLPAEVRASFRLAALIVCGLTVFRIAILIASPLELYPDEAQYWWWAQSPDVGYFSKPPFIAWLIRLTTFCFGNGEWAVRLSIPILHAGTSLLIFAIAHAVYPRDPRVGFWSALAYLTLPGVSYSSGLASTDPPLLFFWALALYALLRGAAEPKLRWSLLCGAGTGLGFLSKYAMGFFPVGVAFAAMTYRPVRMFVFSRHGLVAAATVLLIVAPNAVWNTLHGFPTVVHLGTNAHWSGLRFDPVRLVLFLAGQFGVFGPVFMAAWLAAIWRILRRREESPDEHVLAALSFPVLALIAAQAFASKANANWAAAAYVSATPMAIAHIVHFWPRPALWASVALDALVLVFLAVLLVRPPMAAALGLGGIFKREEGWHALAQDVEAEAKRGGFAIIASDNRSVVAELLYYLPRRRSAIRIWSASATDHNHFEMTIRLRPAPRVLMLVQPGEARGVLSTFESGRLLKTVATPVGGADERTISLYDARFYRGTANPY